MRTRTFAALLSSAAIVLSLTACGSEPSTGIGSTTQNSSQAKDFNDADVTFAQQMIPHHAQAVDMAKLAPSRSASPAVRQLASTVEKAQQPEIDLMTGWLRSWGAPSAGTDHSGHGGMSGMMTAEQLGTLTKASGADFDRQWLTMMIEHHRGAIEMAKTEQRDGRSAEAKKLAGQIIAAQQTEIDEMSRLLKG